MLFFLPRMSYYIIENRTQMLDGKQTNHMWVSHALRLLSHQGGMSDGPHHLKTNICKYIKNFFMDVHFQMVCHVRCATLECKWLKLCALNGCLFGPDSSWRKWSLSKVSMKYLIFLLFPSSMCILL